MKKILSSLISLILIFNFVSCDLLLPNSSDVSNKQQYVNVSSINLNQTNIIGYKGNTYLLSATINPSNATNASITWASNKPSVASVSNIGLVTFNNPGEAIISAVSADGAKAYCNVIVERNIEHVVINITMENAGKYFDFSCTKENRYITFGLTPKREYRNAQFEFQNVCYTVTGNIFYRNYNGYGFNKDFTFTLYLNRAETVMIPSEHSISTYSYKIVNVSGTMSYDVEH